ncbi:hypothetical protein ACSGAP_004164, partial [Salmonella bongori]
KFIYYHVVIINRKNTTLFQTFSKNKKLAPIKQTLFFPVRHIHLTTLTQPPNNELYKKTVSDNHMISKDSNGQFGIQAILSVNEVDR